MNSKSEITQLHGVGKKRAALYRKLDITTVGGLLYFYPRNYLDMTDVHPAIECCDGVYCCLKVTVAEKCPPQYIRRGMTLFKVNAFDPSCRIVLTFFNNRYAYDSLCEGECYLVYGKLSTFGRSRKMNAPIVVPFSEDSTMKPVYRLTAGLSSNMIAANVREALSILQNAAGDYLPASLRKEYGLCHISYALENIHFPKDTEALAVARKRLCFEELLIVQLALQRIKTQNRVHSSHPCPRGDLSDFYGHLPFTPTGAQQRAIADCMADMQKNFPMNRLVQGDVGSGKTLVAAAAAFLAFQNGYQTAMMAPTEILAAQHLKTMRNFLEPLGMKVGLLTGSMKAAEKKEIYRQLADGTLSFVVGTHALITPKVEFSDLGLVITDEQHRFGVEQRAVLSEKGQNPHTLVMSATPIPRTLSLILYGDLDLSVIDEMPAGRVPVDTFLIDSDKRERAYGFLKKHIEEGRQGYIVCPLIEHEDDEPSDLFAVDEYAEQLKKFLPDARIGILHGKMKPAQKDAVMADFRDRQLDILVCTTVVEVGVDVPNAVIMMIENADRFGLSQLHQLRGRVGRGKYKSTCILVCDSKDDDSVQRLRILCKNSDGFKIAEEDMNLRGAGDLIGIRQHGLPHLKIEGMYTDRELVTQARCAGKALLRHDPFLSEAENRFLKKKVDTMLENIINN